MGDLKFPLCAYGDSLHFLEGIEYVTFVMRKTKLLKKIVLLPFFPIIPKERTVELSRFRRLEFPVRPLLIANGQDL